MQMPIHGSHCSPGGHGNEPCVTKKTLTWPTPRQAQRLVLQSVSSLGPTGAQSFTAEAEKEAKTQKTKHGQQLYQ